MIPSIPQSLSTFTAFNAPNEELKKKLHADIRKFLRDVVKSLGLEKGNYNIRTNMAGVGVFGESILHTDWFYVIVSDGFFSQSMAVMFRSCEGQKDYSGGANQWTNMLALSASDDNMEYWLTQLRKMKEARA